MADKSGCFASVKHMVINKVKGKFTDFSGGLVVATWLTRSTARFNAEAVKAR